MGIGLILQCMSRFVIFWTFRVVSKIPSGVFLSNAVRMTDPGAFSWRAWTGNVKKKKKIHQALHKMFILWCNFKWHKLLWWCSTLVRSNSDQSFPGYCSFIYDTDNIKEALGHVCKWRCVVFEASALLLKIINFWQMLFKQAGSLQEVNTLVCLLLSVMKSLLNTHCYDHTIGRISNYCWFHWNAHRVYSIT